MPSGTPSGPSSARRVASAAAPALLKPIRLITASLSRSRNSRGLSLPGCGFAVTVPTSTKPKPSAGQAGRATPFLSMPAASPTGFPKRTPKASTGACTA
jgi:hypothetical protein